MQFDHYHIHIHQPIMISIPPDSFLTLSFSHLFSQRLPDVGIRSVGPPLPVSDKPVEVNGSRFTGIVVGIVQLGT